MNPENPEENKISSDPSVSQEVLIEELQKIFKAYPKKEEKAFLDKWPVRVAGAAVRGFLPMAGVSLFKPYDPLMKPTVGATFVAQD